MRMKISWLNLFSLNFMYTKQGRVYFYRRPSHHTWDEADMAQSASNKTNMESR